MNLQAQVDAMFVAAEEFKVCKRNKSGSINETSLHAAQKRLVAKLIEAGCTNFEAWEMAQKLAADLAA